MAREKTQEERIAQREVGVAKATLGPGWNHVSDEIRWGLVCAGILGVVVGQAALDDDDATDAQKARVAEYGLGLFRAAAAIRERGWK